MREGNGIINNELWITRSRAWLVRGVGALMWVARCRVSIQVYTCYLAFFERSGIMGKD